MSTFDLTQLTHQQVRILHMATLGKTASEIATALNVRVVTVKTHKTNIYKKMGVRNVTEAAALYQKLNPQFNFNLAELSSSIVELRSRNSELEAKYNDLQSRIQLIIEGQAGTFLSGKVR